MQMEDRWLVVMNLHLAFHWCDKSGHWDTSHFRSFEFWPSQIGRRCCPSNQELPIHATFRWFDPSTHPSRWHQFWAVSPAIYSSVRAPSSANRLWPPCCNADEMSQLYLLTL